MEIYCFTAKVRVKHVQSMELYVELAIFQYKKVAQMPYQDQLRL